MCSQYPGPEGMKECRLLTWSLRVLSVSELETLQGLLGWEKSLWLENSTETLFSLSTCQSLPIAKEKGNNDVYSCSFDLSGINAWSKREET